MSIVGAERVNSCLTLLVIRSFCSFCLATV
ncbi:Uncharacterised protein [Vibrio cholerae]|nr:Uncharacterised protein [Vibrio cholerae]